MAIYFAEVITIKNCLPQQNPWQLPTAEVNLKGCILMHQVEFNTIRQLIPDSN